MSRLLAQSALRSALRDVARQQQPALTRSFSSLPTLRPGITTISAATAQPSIFARRPAAGGLNLPLAAFTPTAAADVVPRAAVTAHPALAGACAQVRCGPRRHMNMNRPSRLIRMRRHGFLSRLRSRTGRKMLQRRKAKGRQQLSA